MALVVPLPEDGSVDNELIREDERQRIARDIHNELGQQLLVLRMDVIKLCYSINDTQTHLHADAGIVLRQLETTMHSLRAIIRGLRPAVLGVGLRVAIQSQRGAPPSHIQLSGHGFDLPWQCAARSSRNESGGRSAYPAAPPS